MLHYSVPVMKAAIDDVKVCHCGISIYRPSLTSTCDAGRFGDKLHEKDKDAVITFNLEPFEPTSSRMGRHPHTRPTALAHPPIAPHYQLERQGP
jgi:hypothetical protein